MTTTVNVTEFTWTPENRALLTQLMRRRNDLAVADALAADMAQHCKNVGIPDCELLADALAAIERGDVAAVPSDVLQRVVTIGLVNLSVELTPPRRRRSSGDQPAPVAEVES